MKRLSFVDILLNQDFSTWSSVLTTKYHPKGKPYQGSTVPLSLHHVHMTVGPPTGTCRG